MKTLKHKTAIDGNKVHSVLNSNKTKGLHHIVESFNPNPKQLLSFRKASSPLDPSEKKMRILKSLHRKTLTVFSTTPEDYDSNVDAQRFKDLSIQ